MSSQAYPSTGFVKLPTDFFSDPEAANRFIDDFTAQLPASEKLDSSIASYPPANEGSLAATAEPKGSGLIDIVKKYPWTLSNKNREDIPYIELIEHKITGGSIQKQFEFYTKGISDASGDLYTKLVEGAQEPQGILQVYDGIFRPDPTKFRYKFPYFAKASYELNTNQWQQFDSVAQSLNQIVGGVGKLFGKKGTEIAGAVNTGMEAAASIAQTALQFNYPVVGIADRPRIFTAHNERSITIEFPLYNTFNSNSWKENCDFIELFMFQNLFNKRNFVTGLPPSWYRVEIPGTYYSVASCVTNFVVENLGNTRIMNKGYRPRIVPDAYQVRITLQEMAMPSKNQFQSAITGESRVNSRIEEIVQTVEQAARANGILPE
jgi:hypothetical protein